MSSHSEGPKGPKKPRRKRRRKPHNAKVPHFGTLSEILEAIGAEPREYPAADGETTMTRKERFYRLMIDRALNGDERDLVHLLRLVVKYPNIAVRREELHYFITRSLGGLV